MIVVELVRMMVRLMVKSSERFSRDVFLGGWGDDGDVDGEGLREVFA